jgi:membrane protease YdiL (CAAX protease family)
VIDPQNLYTPPDEISVSGEGVEPHSSKPASAQPEKSGVSLWEFLCWFLILLVVGLQMLLVSMSYQAESEEDSGVDISGVKVQAKMLVFAKQFQPAGGNVPPLAIDGTYAERLARIVLLAELNSAAEASAELTKLDEVASSENYAIRPLEQQLRDIVEQVLAAHQTPGPIELPEAEAALLSNHFGWLGALALHPASKDADATRAEILNQATFSAALSLVAIGLLLLWGLTGLIGGVFVLIWLISRPGSARDRLSDSNPVIYLETFTWWIVVFFGTSIALGIAVSFLEAGGWKSEELAPLLISVQVPIFLGSLGVLVWPLWRGLTWAQVREDIGWTKLGSPLEALWGVLGYWASVPLLVVGLLGTFLVGLVVQFLSPSASALESREIVSHPIQEYLQSGNWAMIGIVVFLACVCAPVVEETAFRGVLYRYLRDRSRKWAVPVSVAGACVVNGVIFAAIHPQGIVGIPILTSLAVALTLIRFYRGSLWPPMVVHAVHNFGAAMIGLLLLS